MFGGKKCYSLKITINQTICIELVEISLTSVYLNWYRYVYIIYIYIYMLVMFVEKDEGTQTYYYYYYYFNKFNAFSLTLLLFINNVFFKHFFYLIVNI